MNSELFEKTKLAAYFLWEYTAYDNALELWHCAEDMACYLDRAGVTGRESIAYIKGCGKHSEKYVAFVRHIAYRIYIFTKNDDHLFNWFASEQLMDNYEWCEAVTTMANIYHNDGLHSIGEMRLQSVRDYYQDQSGHAD